MICTRCGKGTQVGMQVSHSHIRTKKRFQPNLHLFKGRRYCTKCLRVVKPKTNLSLNPRVPV